MERKNYTTEVVSQTFSIHHIDKVFHNNNTPEPEENTIIHYVEQDHTEKQFPRFVLMKTIEGMQYVFTLGEYIDGWGLRFKTQEYEYARTSLSAEAQDELGKTVASFINTVKSEGGVAVDEIYASPADTSYTAEEIEECRDKIVSFTKGKISRETLIASYKPEKLFDLYKDIMGTHFHEIPHYKGGAAKSRGRYLRRMFAKYLPDWKIVDDNFSIDFILKYNKSNIIK